MKILVISGFLGSGKTTFIKMLAEKTKRDFVVLENEYGQADIDSKLLRTDTELNIYELTQGCVCCSMKQDFASSILTIANTLDPEFLIVEPTGVAKLGSILENIGKIQYERIALLKPVTLLDTRQFEQHRQRYADIYADQLATASSIVLTKQEQADEADICHIKKHVREYNQTAALYTQHYSTLPDAWWEGLLCDYLAPEKLSSPSTQNEIELESLSIGQVELDSPAKLIAFLDALVAGVFGSIVRAKGFLPCAGAMLRFDVVDRSYAITGMEPTHENPTCVFIGSQLRRGWLRELLQPSYRRRRVGQASVRPAGQRRKDSAPTSANTTRPPAP